MYLKWYNSTYIMQKYLIFANNQNPNIMTVNYYHCRNNFCMVNISRTFCKAVFLGQKELRCTFYKGKINSSNSAVCYKKR